MAAEDALFTLTEGALKVASATNRVLSVVGASASAAALKRTLEALNSDLPKLSKVDVAGVRFGTVAMREIMGGAVPDTPADDVDAPPMPVRKPAAPSFPVCGILTKPYPCLVMRSGARVLEGAPFGDGTILKIDVDSVIISNSAGRVTWKP